MKPLPNRNNRSQSNAVVYRYTALRELDIFINAEINISQLRDNLKCLRKLIDIEVSKRMELMLGYSVVAYSIISSEPSYLLEIVSKNRRNEDLKMKKRIAFIGDVLSGKNDRLRILGNSLVILNDLTRITNNMIMERNI